MRAFYLPDEGGFLRWLEIPGADPPIIWLHGIWCSSTGELATAAVQPALRGRRSLLVDLFGYGYSDRPEAFGYAVEDHARSVVALVDGLGIERCVLFGHSMGGTIATLVAAARPGVVATLIVAEANLDGGPGLISGGIAAEDEAAFVAGGFAARLAEQRAAARERGELPAAHVGITALVSARALHRAAASLVRGCDPPARDRLRGLSMPRYYLNGERSAESALPPQPDLVAAGVEWRTVPQAGHPMALENPAGLAEIIAELIADAGSRTA
ncbi:MAG TPA: alpha/beta hydrolase [Candidatus Limnocylindrales bacterium]|nr:alpha/beta hydrolase [Candidatus Limnocylindrales bacterium]